QLRSIRDPPPPIQPGGQPGLEPPVRGGRRLAEVWDDAVPELEQLRARRLADNVPIVLQLLNQRLHLRRVHRNGSLSVRDGDRLQQERQRLLTAANQRP